MDKKKQATISFLFYLYFFICADLSKVNVNWLGYKNQSINWLCV